MNAIPWYRSPVFAGALVSILSQLAVLLGLSDQISNDDIAKSVDAGLQLAALGAALFAAIKRWRSNVQPLAATAAGAERKSSGFARPQLLVALVLAMFPLALVTSCATTPADVLAIACDRSSNYSVERCAKGIGETWEVYQKRAAELVADPTTPADVKRAIQTAEAASRPVVVEVLRTGAVVAQIRADLAAGASADDKLAIASARLDEHIALALPRVRGMREALGL